MAITTYSELQAAIANWADRSDLTSRIPEFIALAESDIRADLLDSQLETRKYATTSTTSDYLALPDDFRAMRRIQLVYAGVTYQVEQRTPAELARYDDGGTGLPVYFAVIGDQLQFWPSPDAAYRVEMTYIKDLPALTDSNTSNWMLSDFPNVYLYGSMKHAAVYMLDDKRIQLSDQLYRDAFAGVMRQNVKRKYGGHPLRAKPV